MNLVPLALNAVHLHQDPQEMQDMWDRQGPQALLGNQAAKAAAYLLKETQVQLVSLGYKDGRGVGDPKDPLDLMNTKDVEGLRVI